MAKAGALSTTTWRSQSPALPVSSTCTGAGKLASASGSCTWPSVTRIAPAMRSAGSSAVASASAVMSWVPSSLVSVTRMRVHLERPALAQPVEPRLEPLDRLRQLRVAPVDRGWTRCRRSRRWRCWRPARGPRAGATARPAPPAGTSAARPRSHHPVSPRQSASATPIAASAASAAISGRGSSGEKAIACIYCPSRSRSAGTCT